MLLASDAHQLEVDSGRNLAALIEVSAALGAEERQQFCTRRLGKAVLGEPRAVEDQVIETELPVAQEGDEGCPSAAREWFVRRT